MKRISASAFITSSARFGSFEPRASGWPRHDDSSLEEAGFEPSVPPQEGTGSPAALIESVSRPAWPNCEKDSGTTSSNPLSSSGGRANCGASISGRPILETVGFNRFLLLMDQTHPI